MCWSRLTITFEGAWEIAIDESVAIDESDVPEAYGFYGENAALKLRQAGELAEAGDGEYPELVEGYEMQSNSSGTGIVNVDHYAWLREMAREDFDKLRLVIRDDETECEAVKFAMVPHGYMMTVRGKTKSFRSYGLLANVGSRLRKLERAIGACNVETTWEQS